MNQYKTFRDVFGMPIEKDSRVVFIDNNELIYGEVAGYDNIGGILHIKEFREGSHRLFIHQWVSGNDPTIMVRN